MIIMFMTIFYIFNLIMFQDATLAILNPDDNPTTKKAYQNPPINIQNIKELYLLIKILELLNQLLKKQLMHN